MMTRKLACALLCVMAIALTAGCANGNGPDGALESTSKEALGDSAASGPDVQVDIDLAPLSSAVAYSEVYNIWADPDKYIGKTVRMSGGFSTCTDETGQRYFSCVVKDSAGCCEEELEFVLAGEHSYPADYPKESERITVTGVLDTYIYDGDTICTLKDAELT